MAMILRDKKGQAALTDAMFFLLIVTGLSVFLYSFANTFGANVDRGLLRQGNSDFASSALSTILYSSTPRDPANSIYQDGVEIDHLLAYIKEDFATEKTGAIESLSDETKMVLAKNVYATLSPISNSFDYLFFIYIKNEDRYVFAFMHLSNPAYFCKYAGNAGLDACRNFDPSKPAHSNLFCTSLSAEKISSIYARAGSTGQAFSTLKLVRKSASSASEPSTVPAEADLIIWSPVDLKEVIDQPTSWGCEEKQGIEFSVNPQPTA
ncbi:MAG: hypothetical protein V1494_02250 [Candidatus Diapherotrites archaeon]